MHRHAARNAFSILLAFLLVLTCNNAILHPLTAYGAGGRAATSMLPSTEEGEGGTEGAPSPDVAPADDTPESGTSDVVEDGTGPQGSHEREVSPEPPLSDESDDLLASEEETPLVEPNENSLNEGEAQEAEVETSELLFDLGSATNSDPDKTHDLDQLLLGVAAFSYQDVHGVSHDIPNTGTDEAPVYDFSAAPFASIDNLYMEVIFKILVDDESPDLTREIKAGDYYRYALPSIFKVDENKIPQTIYSPLGLAIATYTIEKDDQGRAYFKVVFTDTVNLDKGYVSIFGGVGATFKLDKDKLQETSPTDEQWLLQNGGTTYTFSAPPTSSNLVGIEKGGTYNKDDTTITWTITVGSKPESAGLALKGITVIDTFNESELAVASVTGPDGAELVKPADVHGSTFSYTFPDDSTAVAPYDITVKTKVSEAVLNATVKGQQQVTNSVKMESPQNAEIVVPPDQGTTESVTVPQFGITKSGQPLNSSIISWDIVINKGGVGAAKNVVVYDQLDARATYRDGTLKVDGAPLDKVYDAAPNPAPSGIYAVKTIEASDNTTLLEIHFDGVVSTEQRITFETDIAVTDDGDKKLDITFPNQAWMAYDWPTGGPGPGENDTKFDITTNFNVAYLDKSTPTYDEHTGIIDWTIKPSTRSEDYTQGVITDVVGLQNDGTFDQELLTDSVAVTYKGVPLTKSELAAVFSYDADSHVMTFTFERALYELNDLEITYKSQALNFQRENDKDHTYKNTANLTVTAPGHTYEAADSAERTFKNVFLTKTSNYTVVDTNGNSTGYLNYRITVNGNQMPNTELTMADDLKAITARVVDLSGAEKTTIDALKWTFVNGDVTNSQVPSVKVTKRQGNVESEVTSVFKTAIDQWVANRVVDFSVTGAAEASACYIIDLPLTLDKAVLQALYQNEWLVDGFRILVKNTAMADSDGYLADGGAVAECIGTQDTPDISEQFAAKSVDGSRQKDGILDYRIALNPNGLQLTNAVATDEFDEALEIDLSTVQLYYAEHEGASIKEGHGAPVAAGWSKELVYDAMKDKVVLKVKLPDGAASFVLEYQAKIVGPASGGKVTNTVSVVMGGTPLGDDTISADVDASSWGWLTQKAIYKLVKVDAFSGETAPLSGVRFFLSKEDDQNTILKTAVSNKDGLVSFYGLEPNTVYHFKEDAASVGETKYHTTEGSFTTGAKGTTIIQGQDKAVKNARTTSNVPVVLKKTYTEINGLSYQSARQSTFTLSLYPNGFGTNPKVPLAFAENAEGSYTYSAAGSVTELHEAALGDLTISGLPWGEYGLEETATSEGYTRFEGAKYFSVIAPGQVGEPWKVNYEPTGTAHDVTPAITNASTKLTVKKTTTAPSLEGVELSIYKANADGSQSAEKAKNAFDGAELSTRIDEAKQVFTWTLDGIPAGMYWLVEDTGPIDATLSKFDPVKFTVDAFGKVSKDEGIGSVEGTTLTVQDNPAHVTVKKLDQWGEGVVNATVKLQKSDGAGGWTDVAQGEWKIVTTGEATEGHTFAGLDRGAKYRLIETVVPIGYKTANHEASQVIEFTINEYGKATLVDLHNGLALEGDADKGAFQNVVLGNSFILRNERIVGHAEFFKQDSESGKALSGASFDLYLQGSDEPVNAGGHFVSGDDGKVTTIGSQRTFSRTIGNAKQGDQIRCGLPAGTYYFKEVATRSDFLFEGVMTEPFTIPKSGGYTWPSLSVVAVQSTSGDAFLTNTPLNAQAHLVKQDKNSTALMGATFELRPVVGGVEQAAIDTRTTAAAGTPFEVEDSNHNPHSATATQAGELWFPNVPAGTYHVVETIPAPGYQVDGTHYEFTVNQTTRNQKIALNNGKPILNKLTELSFKKTELFNESCSGDPTAERALAGAKFRVYTDESCLNPAHLPDGSEAVTTSASDGSVTFRGLGGGNTYYVKETVTPAGHVPSEVHKAVFAPNGTLSSFAPIGSSGVVKTIVNDVVRTDISIKKVSELDPAQVLPGSTYGLYKSVAKAGPHPQGASLSAQERAALQLIAEATTDQNGILTFKGVLMNQEYVIQERVAPDGSLVSKNPIKISFKVGAGGAPELKSFDDGSGTAQIVNGDIVWREPQVVVEFQKVDPAGRPLAGATLQVVDESDTVVEGPWVSSDTAHVVTGKFVAGKEYRLVELEAPEGYALATDVKFVVSDTPAAFGENRVTKVSMTDRSLTPPPSPGGPDTPDPDDPYNPDNPDNPSDPSDPDNPENPDNPDQPNTPGDPDKPENPESPDKPENPGGPSTPGTPTPPADSGSHTPGQPPLLVGTGDAPWGLPVAVLALAAAATALVAFRRLRHR